MVDRVFCGELVTNGQSYPNVALLVEAGRVVAWERFGQVAKIESPDVDARTFVVLPGMLDIHIHGGGGRDLMEGTPEAVQFVAQHLARFGVTGFLVTPLTSPWHAIRQTVQAAAEVRQHRTSGAQVLGCHLEGPYINPKFKGAQPPEYILPAGVAEFEREIGDWMNEIKIVTLAPEIPGGYELTRYLSRQGVIVSIGHTNATYEEVTHAIDDGARHATHCFCAMRGMHHRDPGTAGAVLSHPELKAELIWDHIHVVPPMVKVLFAAKGIANVIAISDGTTGVGMPEGYTFTLWEHEAIVQGGVARLAEDPQNTLAGSAIAMDTCLKHATHMFDLGTASIVCSENPARALGLENRKGTLRVGADADFFLWNQQRMQVESTYIGGRLQK
jgi:N-acetylglucosamine-6-phosphate deacetylase